MSEIADLMNNITTIAIAVVVTVIVGAIIAKGIKVVRPTNRLIVERLGKFKTVRKSGITYVIPFIEQGYQVNITEQMTDAEKQEVITSDNLNCVVAALIRYKVKDDDESVKASQYNVNNYQSQIVALTRTTLRNVIGSKPFKEVNNKRNVLNVEIKAEIEKEAAKWGIDIVASELKEIDPPKDVQATMNDVIKASNAKEAAQDKATAAETEADGERRAMIKKAEGESEAAKRKAEGEAQAIETVAKAKAEAIRVVNDAAEESFKPNAQKQRAYEVMENSLANNAKIIITKEGIDPSIIVGGFGNGADGSAPVVIPEKKKVPEVRSTRDIMEGLM